MNKSTYAGMMGGCVSIGLLFLLACNMATVKPPETDIVEQPEKFEVRVSDNLKKTLAFIMDNKGRLNDTVLLANDSLVYSLYEKENFQSLWCAQENWSPLGDSLYAFIERSREYGLFPSDYHLRALTGIRTMIASDSIAHKNAALWSRADLMLTDAFFLAARHLKLGRLDKDSITMRNDSLLGPDFYTQVFHLMRHTSNVTAAFHDLEPKHARYDSLKAGLKFFLDSIQTFRRYTYVNYPNKDSATLYNALQRRFFEEDILPSATQPMDTAAWRQAFLRYQQAKGLKPTGKVNENTVNSLNNTDWEKFKRVAMNLDRYKMLPDTLPLTYIWVNIPAYNMQVMNMDTLIMESRVIVGLPKTRTPLLTSNVSNFIIYPQWTVPYSIIFKEMLPKIQKNVEYLNKENLMVVDKNDSIIDPYTIDWSKLSKRYFPYLLKQRQGDDNSLGVLKFNFANKYSVYLHDTNARWLFARSNRALSHGCVRVKEFLKLADFLVRADTVKYHPDTLRNWIARQEKHIVSGFHRVPIFIRYFSCEGKNGKLKIYDDIYAEDKILRERYFADKSIL
ncbi:L,D-transpeptidase family protein [Pseudoflavitalea sp. X16]|uniref:L,D-transpeptidase family protein n=1 Tax=Paraflavitalea devenefica TaxID=2716334 RepID=UPI001423E663|nr:L,D-transpeptidase family protein [Paraflavitalea devenefica]NII25614.1 L,D-transpeptidase family protein [Paraflavitalea devenefica]